MEASAAGGPGGAPSAPSSGAQRGPKNQRGRGKGRGGNRGRGGNQRGGNTSGQNDGDSRKNLSNPAAQDLAAAVDKARISAGKPPVDEENADDDAEVCFICANPVSHHSIAPCNHTTCHICGLRMRALYKDKNCAHCRTSAPYVIFAPNADKRFEDFTSADITTTDDNIGIKYANEDIVGDTVLLLRYNCPDADCDFAGLGWPDLHRHVKSAHKKRMCDLCTRNKRVFTHEHELFADKELEKHMRYGDDKPGAADQTGFKGHPLCGFCGERFYDDDKLYEHCRNKHERCFICDRRDSRKPHYYRDYNALEEHFKKDHYLCKDRECLEKKFVVFDTDMDLQAHQLSEHGGKATGRDARLVDISGFDIRTPYQDDRREGGRRDRRREGRGGGGGGGGGRGGRWTNENAEPVPVSSAQPLRRDEIAFQRQMAIHSAQSVSNRTFGGQLSAPAATSTPPSGSRNNSSPSTPRPTQNRNANNAEVRDIPQLDAPTVDPANMTPEERARAVRHGSVVERASNLLHNDARKLATFREHISTYRQGKFTAPELVDAFFTLFGDTSSNALGTLLREVADLFDDKVKSDALRKAWQDWRAINEDYPSLPGLSGMHGATSSSSGWATAGAASPALPTGAPAQKHSNRVLKLKNSTRLGPAPVSRSQPTWVASASTSIRPPASAGFPSLPPSSKKSTASSSSTPSWNTGSAAQASQSSASSSSAPLNNRPRPKANDKDAFPALPSAPKPQTTIFGYGSGRGVRRDLPGLGGRGETGFSWGGESGQSSDAAAADENADKPAEGQGKKGGKKGKKQVLVQWG
ncbi:unnamed protein product [Clonostachys rosea f. rosea IK726]|uniref:RING-type E3 ubiquitin transferase n=2 Tax=Bionectria ochroleuca TaxID=29856 RepID=A0A0B7KB70_BIOOC|nr:unnamed protein product [Clonostachys rosea f. rosea IK726]